MRRLQPYSPRSRGYRNHPVFGRRIAYAHDTKGRVRCVAMRSGWQLVLGLFGGLEHQLNETLAAGDGALAVDMGDVRLHRAVRQVEPLADVGTRAPLARCRGC